MEKEPLPVKPIDIREIVRSKSPSIARMLPGFVYRYIHRIIHVDYINYLLKEFGHLDDLEFLRAIIKDFNVNIVILGEENLPADGRFIFAGNHPLGGFDGIILLEVLTRRYSQVRFLVNDILMNITPIKGLFVPINKHGAHSREAARMIDQAMQSDMQILTFPSGLVSRKIKGRIADLAWKKNFIHKAIEHKRDVIPVYFTGRNSNWFYFLAKLRKFLHISWNLEMFYLPDETYKHRNKTVCVRFGKPIPWQAFTKDKTAQEWTEYVRGQVYAMAAEADQHC